MHKDLVKALILAAIFCLQLFVEMAKADTLPLPQYSLSIAGPQNMESGELGTITATDGSYVLMARTTSKGVEAKALFDKPGGSASASIVYYYEVSGPDYMIVPITISYRLEVASISNGLPPYDPINNIEGSGFSAGAYITASSYAPYQSAYMDSVYDGHGCIWELGGRMELCSTETSANKITDNIVALNALSNVHFQIKLGASARNAGWGIVTASADPYIAIDPAFHQLHPEFSVHVSTGIDNSATSPIPEPSSILLLGIGILGLGINRWKR